MVFTLTAMLRDITALVFHEAAGLVCAKNRIAIAAASPVWSRTTAAMIAVEADRFESIAMMMGYLPNSISVQKEKYFDLNIQIPNQKRSR